MKRVRRADGFRWEDVPEEPYKETGDTFRGVVRHTLFDAAAGAVGELRYFEIAPGGWSTLERHDHPHAVVVIRGRGRALVGAEIHDLAPRDLVHVPPATWHQFRSMDDAPLGFLCLVDPDRDRPERPSAEALERLRSDPAIAAFVRA